MKMLRIKGRPLSLATRLAVFIFLINTVVLTALGIYYARKMAARIEGELVNGSAVPAMLMKQNRQNFKLVHDPLALRQLVGRPIDQAMVISPAGQITYALDESLEGISLPKLSSRHSLFLQLTQTDYEVHVFRSVVRTPDRRNVLTPIVRRGELEGYLWLSVNVENDTLAKQQMALFFFLGSLAAILFCGFSQFVLVHHLVIPRVRRMARCVQFVEKGELYVRIDGSRMHDELGELETSINQMVAEVESRSLVQKELVHKLQSAKDEAETANHCKSEFLANISHELRTPMVAVIGLSDLLMDSSVDEKQREYVEAVRQSGEWLLSILDNILALVQMENGTARRDKSKVSLPALLEEMQSYYRPIAAGCGLEFSCSAGEDVPDCVFVAVEALQQILGNLLLNGFKFTHEGYVRLRAELVGIKEEDSVAEILFIVQDSGVGIAQEMREKIFDAFTQADGSHSRKYGGVGLGLTISRQLVELLGGELQLSSELGEGSTFSFAIDMDLEGPEEDEPEEDEPPEEMIAEPVLDDSPEPVVEPEPEAPPALPKVLVVEDNKVNRMMMKAALKRSGCEVIEAEDGQIALEVLGLSGDQKGSVDVDLIMMDIQMPNMDGMEATRHIRERQSEGAPVPIIAVTAHLMEDDCEAFVDEFMNGYLPKPVSPKALAEVLEKFVALPETSE